MPWLITATWDDDAKMWVADSDDIPGIAAEAPNEQELLKKLLHLVPEMAELNNVPLDRSKPQEILVRYLREAKLRLRAAG